MNAIEIASKKELQKKYQSNKSAGNKVYSSLSRVLKDMQRDKELKAGYAECFKALNMPFDGTITMADFKEAVQPEQEVTINKGKKNEEIVTGIWGTTQKKDKDGNKMFEADGTTPIMIEVCRPVRSWTPNKVLEVLADSAVILARKAAK